MYPCQLRGRRPAHVRATDFGSSETVTVRVFGGVFHGGTALVTAGLLQCFNDAGGLFCFRTDITTNGETQFRGR